MQNTITQNRLYKDRLFVSIYGKETEQSKKWRLDLYNALNDSHYTDPDAIELTTIDNIIYITMHNDVSFLIGNQMNLYEQQSTYNPICLSKIASLQFLKPRIFDSCSAFVTSTSRRHPWRISSASFRKCGNSVFAIANETATMLNINIGHNNELHKKCKSLYDYCKYVDTIKQNLKKMPRQEAIENAVDEAIKQKLLGGFFKDQRMEIMNMSLTEFDQEEYDRHRRAEGREQGIHEAQVEAAINLYANGVPVETIAKSLHMSEEQVKEIVAEK